MTAVCVIETCLGIAGYSLGQLITSALTNLLGYLSIIYVVCVCCVLLCVAGIVLRVIERLLKRRWFKK